MLTELQTDNKLVGLKQSIRAIEGGNAKKVFLASDADAKIRTQVSNACSKKNIEILSVPTMAELGKACGINIGAAVAVILCD